VHFFAISACDTHFKSELHPNGTDGPGQPAYDIFSIERTFFQNLKFWSLKFKESFVRRPQI